MLTPSDLNRGTTKHRHASSEGGAREARHGGSTHFVIFANRKTYLLCGASLVGSGSFWTYTAVIHIP